MRPSTRELYPPIIEEPKQPSYWISPAKSSGLIAMTKAIMPPMANPIIVPAATPRQSTFCSPLVISHLQMLPPLYRNPRSNCNSARILLRYFDEQHPATGLRLAGPPICPAN